VKSGAIHMPFSDSRKDIIDTLVKWSEGKFNQKAVFDWANALFLKENVTYEDWEGDDSVTNEVNI
jgi:hypothetical protein